MIEQLRYYTLDELQVLSLEELQALWELVPTDRQKAYRAAYDREVRNAGAIGSDDLERQVAAELLRRYDDTSVVPAGSRWARTPIRVQDAARENDTLATPDDDQKATRKPEPRVMLVMGLLALVFIGVLLPRLLGSGSKDSETDATPPASHTATPEISPTPTPLALEAQDEVITGGDSARAVAYPVNLQVVLPEGDTPPRVWVVQRRVVRAAEWNYDLNPDIASFVNGMSVRPVIGIPWSVDNADWFDAMGEGAMFNLTMNTGAILRYEFAAKTEVRRSDTNIFRQVGPGLVLLLIGETDEDGLPTATRTLVTATYPPEQELGRLDELISLAVEPTSAAPATTPTPTNTPQVAIELDVQLISVTTIAGQITTRLRIYSSGYKRVTFTPDDIWLALGYTPDPPGPRIPAEGMQPFDLLPEQAVDLNLIWYWADEPYVALQVGSYRFAIQLL